MIGWVWTRCKAWSFEQTGVLTQQVDTSTVTRALQGESGVEFVDDYRGVEVLSAYGSLKVGPTRWAVMAEIDAQEIDRNAAEERPRMTGILTFFYGLSLWSVWYWRGRHVQGLNEEYARMDLDLESGDFGDSSA